MSSNNVYKSIMPILTKEVPWAEILLDGLSQTITFSMLLLNPRSKLIRLFTCLKNRGYYLKNG